MHLLTNFLIAIALLSSCGESSKTKQSDQAQDALVASPLQWELVWQEVPAANTEDTEALLILKNAIDPSVVTIDPQMPIHGHGTVTAYQKIASVPCADEEDACFKITGFFFIMPGPWEINITIALGDEELTHSFAVEVR